MSLLIFDEQINREAAIEPLESWATVRRLKDVRPREMIDDDRVPDLLRRLNHPTFVTIDGGFWDRQYRDKHYCIPYIAVSDDQQFKIPALLRQLFRLPEFKTKTARVGKVARISSTRIEYLQVNDETIYTLNWPALPRKRWSCTSNDAFTSCPTKSPPTDPAPPTFPPTPPARTVQTTLRDTSFRRGCGAWPRDGHSCDTRRLACRQCCAKG